MMGKPTSIKQAGPCAVLQTLSLQQMGDEDDSKAGMDDSNKSLRKREREKKRRDDQKEAFDELANILRRVDPDLDDDGGQDVGSRADMIRRACVVLMKLKRENSELKRRPASYSGGDAVSVYINRHV